MELLFNQIEPDNHLEKIKFLISQAEQMILCSGWIKIGGLKLLSEDLESAIQRNAKITIISNKSHTDKSSINYLKNLNIQHICIDKSKRYFHTKMYYFRTNAKYHLIIGSANLTAGALTSNEELSILVSGQVDDTQHEKVNLYLKRLTTEYNF